MKAKIQIQKGNDKITFYLVSKSGRSFLFHAAIHYNGPQNLDQHRKF